MKKLFFCFLLLFVISFGFSQNSKLWNSYFSYTEIKDISESSTKFVAASENALFSKDIASGTIKTINTVDGLPGQTISTIYHSTIFKKTLVGYENGLLVVINEEEGTMKNVVDIINKSIPPNVKKINHFMEYEGVVYISCDFGIVQYNLQTLQFGDTYFIGNNGAQIIVKQTAIYDNKIYAATFVNGIRVASLTNLNLNDFNQWTTIDANGWTGIESIDNKLYAVSNTGYLYTIQGNTFNTPVYLLEPSVDMRKSGDFIIITTKNHIYIYNSSLILIQTINSTQIVDVEVKFSCATVINDIIYIGTTENGVLTKTLTGNTYDNITPDGPLRNSIFALSTISNGFWAVFGGYDLYYNPDTYIGYSATQFGISKFSDSKWKNIPYSELQGAKALSRITVNPNNEKQIFVSSFKSGLLKFENDELVQLYTAANTGTDGLKAITGTSPPDIRINGAAFDSEGSLWVTNSQATRGLTVFKNQNQWQSFDMQSVKVSGKFNFGKLTIDKNGTKWMTSRNDGVIGFNEKNGNVFKSIREGTDVGNLPADYTSIAAVDKRNQLWIGTQKGIRVLPSVDNFMSEEQLETNPIIIIEENLAQELLYQQFITDIVVDGANNKWIGTADSGVFQVSPDGQQTLHHFTIDNSPLPSNVINDIDIDGITGEVYFATTKGMVSYKGTSTDAKENLENVYVYPNPVRPEFTGTVKISGLIDRATIKIADIEGNLVYETTSEGGTIEWDTTAFGKYKVASGVYMIFISAEDGIETKGKKVMIIR